jgi:type VI secretion system protein ImpA
LTLDINRFLVEVSADNVCGEDLQYDPAFIALEQDIKGKPEQQMGNTIQEAEPPNWREIRKTAEELLTRTRDLRVLINLLRALIATDGISGFSVGLNLLKQLVELRWDSIYPQLDPDDDNDPTERVNILMSLCDQDTILRPLQLSPLVESKALGRFNIRDFNIATGKIAVSDGVTAVGLSTIEAAVQDTELESLRRNYNDVVAALECLNALERIVTEQVGISDAPNFEDLRSVLKEAKGILVEWLDSRGAGVDANAEDEDPETDTDAKETANRKKSALSVGINNNQDVLAALKQICEYYKKYEPSSPVPILLERCTRLVGKGFMDVLKDIAPEGIDQASVVMGIRDGNGE